MKRCEPGKCEALPEDAFGAEDEVILRHPGWGNTHIHARRRDLGTVIRTRNLEVEEVRRDPAG